MRSRHPLPRLWMMTDERQGDALWAALGRLPRGAGIVFRHYGLPLPERRALLAKVRRIARRRGLRLVIAAPEGLPVSRQDGVHNPAMRLHKYAELRTFSAHTVPELRAAKRKDADLVFLSPVFPTRSHPGAPTLGPLRFAKLVREAAMPVIALGGMDAARARRLRGSGAYGWAAIDAWTDAPVSEGKEEESGSSAR
ncbi:MAG TPA: thiamine phosphate synthase [Allosphingosinicella sp.]